MTDPQKIPRKVKPWVVILGLLLLSGFLLYSLHPQILTTLAGLLIVEDNLQTADIIFLLNGEVATRPFHAAKLYQEGLAPQIVVAKVGDTPATQTGYWPNETDAAVEIMHAQGVPRDAIIVLPSEDGVASTYDEAQCLNTYAKEHSIDNIILVTSALHTRRTHWIMQRQETLSEVTLQSSCAPHWGFDETNWWHYEDGLIFFIEEYIKTLYYHLKY